MKYRVVYAGYNFFSSVMASLLVRPDIELVLCLTGDSASKSISNVRRLAGKYDIPLHYGPLTDNVLRRIRSVSPDMIFSASYSYRIPVSRLGIKYNLNLHPTLLPYGRGVNPLPYLVTGHSELSGLTVHEMTDQFDAGCIVAQRPIPVGSGWGLNELAMAMYLEAPKLVNYVLDNFGELFANRKPQGEGSYWPKPSREQRTIRWSEPATEIDRKSRQFGSLGILCAVDGKEYEVVHPVSFIEVDHGTEYGRVLLYGRDYVYVAARDGVVRIIMPRQRSGHRLRSLLGKAARVMGGWRG